MKTSSRPRNIGGSFASRRGHGSQLSISDSNHHVTEAIGDMYGDDDYGSGRRDSRPLSFIASPLSESIEPGQYFESPSPTDSRSRSPRPNASINGNYGSKAHTVPALLPSQQFGFESTPISPTRSLRERTPSDTANRSFPLNDIDYESTPAAVQQELHNLQALRRMSMDVGATSDPDLPSFSGVSLMPSIAPSGGDDEDDPSRLFWVPARVHPELAPMEFKTFLENRVSSIKRRSGDSSILSSSGGLSPDGLDRTGSGSAKGLQRKKSMLSRQIDNSGGRGAVGYKDGAERLERNGSLSSHRVPELNLTDLQELDELVKDPTKAMQKLAMDANSRDDQEGDDLPILPAAPGVGLRRSTRTTYRRGSLRKGERVPFSKRAGIRNADTDGDASDDPNFVGAPLTRASTEPITENFSRPNRAGRRGGIIQQSSPTSAEFPNHDTDASSGRSTPSEQPMPQISEGFPQRKTSFPRQDVPVPRIIETPPPSEEEYYEPAPQQKAQYPERSSSQIPPSVAEPTQPIIDEPPPRSSRRPAMGRNTSSSGSALPRAPSAAGQTLNDMAQRPSPLPGNTNRTDALTFIPTFPAEKKTDKKPSKDEGAPKKGSWGWFKGDDKKDKKKDDDSKKGKTRVMLDKAHDATRLDVLQHSIEGAVVKGRESLLLDRDSIDNKLEGERKKESARKTSSEPKREKDGIFSSLFGGGKKKGEREYTGKKASSLRTLSPEPPQRTLKPDIDYNWTRFSIIQERAIYRMAHIKLANPRRALHSQVLLSNFMYSYLAKVQQMHPHVQIPQSAQQKKQIEMERRQKEEEQRQAEQQQQQGDQYRYDYHQGIAEYADQPPAHEQGHEGQHDQPTQGVTYVDDSQIYDYDHQDDERSQRKGSDRPQSRTAQHGAEDGQSNPQYDRRQGQDYYSYGSQETNSQHDDDNEMW